MKSTREEVYANIRYQTMVETSEEVLTSTRNQTWRDVASWSSIGERVNQEISRLYPRE